VVWLVVTLLTDPEPAPRSTRSTEKSVPPDRDGASCPRERNRTNPRRAVRNAIAWILGIILVYSIMFATGAAIFHNTRQFVIFGGALVASAVLLVVVMRREQADALQ